jgi:hypothetical protein
LIFVFEPVHNSVCAMWTMSLMEFAAWLTLIVVGLALLH